MTIDIRFRHPGLAAAEIAAVEQRVGAPLPPEYRQFLAAGNVGMPAPNVARAPTITCSVAKFLGVSDVASDDLGAAVDTYSGRLPDGVFPVALAAGGNLVCIVLKDGSVHFWDHENEAAEGEPVDFRNMHLLAKSFAEFLKLLAPPDPAGAGAAKVVSVKLKPGFAERFKNSS